jgi:hypothetical protein
MLVILLNRSQGYLSRPLPSYRLYTLAKINPLPDPNQLSCMHWFRTPRVKFVFEPILFPSTFSPPLPSLPFSSPSPVSSHIAYLPSPFTSPFPISVLFPLHYLPSSFTYPFPLSLISLSLHSPPPLSLSSLSRIFLLPSLLLFLSPFSSLLLIFLFPSLPLFFFPFSSPSLIFPLPSLPLFPSSLLFPLSSPLPSLPSHLSSAFTFHFPLPLPLCWL